MNHVAPNTLSERIKRLFGDVPLRQQVAALPWRTADDGQLKVMLITSRDTGRWVLPKGWPEMGEAFSDAAAREAREEAGLKGTVSREAAGRYYYAKTKASGDIPCEVLVFPLEVGKVASKWKEKGQRTRKWVRPEEAAGMVDEPDLGELMLSFGQRLPKASD